MSFFQTEKFPCPSCGTDVEFDVVYSVNAVARPKLRRAILDETFQRETCGSCGLAFRVDPEFTYLDTKGKQWLLARPFADRGEWPSMELYAHSFYETAFGPTAPPTSQAIGRGMACRIVFGWNALREKLLLLDRGLDDVTVELTKMAIVAAMESSPLSDENELRLVDTTDSELLFAWYEAETGRVLEALPVRREVYDTITADPTAWNELKTDVGAGPFTDVTRLWIETVPTAES